MPFALHQVDTGTSVEEVCRKVGISQATFYAWRKKYAGLGVSELRRLKQLEEENRKLKQLVADLSLDKVMLQDVLKKSSEAGPEKTLGRPADLKLPNQREARLQRVSAKSRRMVPAAQSEVTRSAVEEAHARDRERAGALRLLAHLCADSP